MRAFRCHVREGSHYKSRAWWPGLYAIEPLLKIFGPPIGILVELRLDHSEFLSLYCNDGRFSLQNMHNYQHAASYPAFIVSGLVDLLGTRVRLPPGTEQAFLSLAFGVEAFLMTAHKKHEALDATVHFLLALTMWACTLCTLGEMLARHSVLATAGRALSCMMQGMWLIQIGQIMHTTPKPWKVDASMAGIMLAPVLFAMLIVLASVLLFALYLVLQWWYGKSLHQHMRLPFSDSLEEIEFQNRIQGNGDSANEDSDTQGSDNEDRQAAQPKAGSRRHQLLKTFQLFTPGYETKDKGGHLV
ncbi:probable transmembrane protein 45B at N-terminal half [Coccomyxa sp. Obi]|nr:probable transmembrane protein 45B at N-terminal half [Coccomyxa sp. Obi]